jgi:hypothetical protein
MQLSCVSEKKKLTWDYKVLLLLLLLICSLFEQDCLELLNNLIRHNASNQVHHSSKTYLEVLILLNFLLMSLLYFVPSIRCF